MLGCWLKNYNTTTITCVCVKGRKPFNWIDLSRIIIKGSFESNSNEQTNKYCCHLFLVMRLDVKISFAEEVQSFVWTSDRRRGQTFLDKNLTSYQSVAAEKLDLTDWILDSIKVEIRYLEKYESFCEDAFSFECFNTTFT